MWRAFIFVVSCDFENGLEKFLMEGTQIIYLKKHTVFGSDEKSGPLFLNDDTYGIGGFDWPLRGWYLC